MAKIKTKLTKAQIAFLDSLGMSKVGPEARKLLTQNAKRQVIVETNRKVFSVKLNDNGNVVMRGLGNRFPVGLRPDSVITLLDHADEIRAVAEQGLALAGESIEETEAESEDLELEIDTDAEVEAEATPTNISFPRKGGKR